MAYVYLILIYFKQKILEGTKIRWGSQNVAKFENGPHTGEVSAAMLQDSEQYVIVGHSERSTLIVNQMKILR